MPSLPEGTNVICELAPDPAASSALRKVDGAWMTTVQVLTTTKAHVDSVCPIAKSACVYYDDDDIYDYVLTEKSTGITYVTQLIFDSQTNVYYVYYRWGDTDYKLEGPHKTAESAKEAFQVTYKEKFAVEWAERETMISEKWVYEVKTYETFEEVDEEDNNPFVSEKTRSLAGGKKGGSAGLSTTAIAAVIGASLM